MLIIQPRGTADVGRVGHALLGDVADQARAVPPEQTDAGEVSLIAAGQRLPADQNRVPRIHDLSAGGDVDAAQPVEGEPPHQADEGMHVDRSSPL